MWRKGAICAVVVGLGACNWVFGLTTQTAPDAPDGPTPDAPLPPMLWTSVSGAFLHSCGIHVDQTLWCWGRNDSGQLALAGVLETDLPTQVGTELWLSVATSEQHTCAIKVDHTLWCWGENNRAQLGLATSPGPTLPNMVPGTWKSVATGSSSTCAIDMTDALWCWGGNDQGQLGNSMAGPADHPDPVLVDGGATWSSIAIADLAACGIHADKSLYCWGWATYGVIGTGSSTDEFTPVQVGTDHFTKVSLGHETACALRVDGKLRCWGEGDHGELGNDNNVGNGTPVVVAQDVPTWTDITVGGFHACGLQSDHTLWCWGDNPFGQLGSDTQPANNSTIPVAVPSPDGAWLTIAAGDNQTCAIGADNQLWCAGLNSGALGTADGGSRTRPVEVGMATSVSTGGDTTCAIDASANLACWGLNNAGMVGDATAFDRQSATMVPGTWSSVATSGSHTCAIATTGALECWGAPGSLGNNTNLGSNVPVLVNSGPWTVVAANSGSCGIASGTPYCWGDNSGGEGGQSVITNPLMAPTEVSGTLAPNWVEIATGFAHSCGIDDAGIHCWGGNSVGELAGMSGPNTTSPTATSVVTGNKFDQLTVGGYHSCARVDTVFWCWGYDMHGELGNEATSHVGPFMLPDPYAQLAAGDAFTCGVRPNGTLWCWGANDYGQLGIGTRLEHHEPVKVNADTDWTTVAAGSTHACATKQDGRLFCWGRNLEGEVGDGKAWRATLELVP